MDYFSPKLLLRMQARFGLLTVALLLSLCAGAQISPTYTLGLNAGLSYQSSDIRHTAQGFGLGLTLGKTLFYQKSAPLAFGLRGRLLYAQQYGLGDRPSFDIDLNSSLNGEGLLDYTQYPANLNVTDGFVFQNHRTILGEGALEGVLSFNTLRENTGIILALYGGAGLDWYTTRFDQADPFGEEYYDAYAGLLQEQSRQVVRQNLRELVLDADYETDAPGGEEWRFMPSVGVEIGYQFAPSFSLTAGHRLTFSRTNFLDGHAWADASNDLYHYTSLGLNFHWSKNRTTTRGQKPEIQILFPTAIPYNTSSTQTRVRARVKHVNSAADITCTLNGQPFAFNFYTDELLVDIPLLPGRNEVRLRASNPFGSDEKLITIFLTGGVIGPPGNTTLPPTNNIPTGQRPTVRFVQPPQAEFPTSQEVFNVRVSVERVVDKNDLQLIVNGQATRNFTFDPGQMMLFANIPLFYGRNDLTVRAANEFGNAEASTTIIRTDLTDPPRVEIVQPGQNPFNTNQSTVLLRATVQGVDDRKFIAFTVNGVSSNNFTFSGSNFQATVPLSIGSNRLVIKASNPSGADQDEVTVQYNTSKNPPVVTITQPTSAQITTTVASAQIKANIQRVTDRNNITFILNGQVQSNFSFQSSTGQLTHTVTLTNGQNTIRIKAVNNDGVDEEQVVITLQTPQPPALAPVVTILEPADKITVSQASLSFKGEIKRISSASQVELRLNNTLITTFQFNQSAGAVATTLTLKPGENTIRLKGTNSSGSDEETVVVTLSSPKLPVVDILEPANNDLFEWESTQLKASVKNVATRSGISVLVNQQEVTDFVFGAGNLTATVKLQNGTNTIRVRATNADGTDEATVMVIYRPPAPKPAITFIEPDKPGKVSEKDLFILQARVQHVTAKSSIKLTFNDRLLSDFEFDPKTGILSASLNLNSGKNTVDILAQNTVGTTTSSTSIEKATPVSSGNKPVISQVVTTQPVSNPFQPNVAGCTITAQISNLTGSNQVSLRVNGELVPDFQFDPNTGAFSADIILKKGSNDLVLRAINRAGSDEEIRTVEF